MAEVRTSAAALRVSGDDLVPGAITSMLGVQPRSAHVKGEKIVGSKTGQVRFTKSGLWMLNVFDREPADVDGQIREIFQRTTQDLNVWREITKKYRVDLFCGLFFEGDDVGLSISPQSLAALGERG